MELGTVVGINHPYSGNLHMAGIRKWGRHEGGMCIGKAYTKGVGDKAGKGGGVGGEEQGGGGQRGHNISSRAWPCDTKATEPTSLSQLGVKWGRYMKARCHVR